MAKPNKDNLKIGVTFTPCAKCDRVEVEHGEWIEVYNETVCSKCHLPPLTKEETNGKIEILTNFCPNCGAKMDGAE